MWKLSPKDVFLDMKFGEKLEQWRKNVTSLREILMEG